MLDAKRHIELYDPVAYREKRVAVIGVGTIGSHTALTLGRMQVPLLIYDHDVIEEHNVATQSYEIAHVGLTKAAAIQSQLIGIGEEPVAIADEYVGQQDTPFDILVSCVDSLNARRAIANALIKNGTNVPIVDGRVGAEQVEVYAYTGANPAQAWLDSLPEAADADPCGARFTAYTANICAGLIANAVKRVLYGQAHPARIIYDAATSTFLKVGSIEPVAEPVH